MLQYPCVHSNLQKTKKFASEISKHNISGKLDVEEDPQIGWFVNTNIQEKWNFTPKTLPVYYADMLMPITKHMKGKKWMPHFQK